VGWALGDVLAQVRNSRLAILIDSFFTCHLRFLTLARSPSRLLLDLHQRRSFRREAFPHSVRLRIIVPRTLWTLLLQLARQANPGK
jgi:hypothetical protein